MRVEGIKAKRPKPKPRPKGRSGNDVAFWARLGIKVRDWRF